MIIVIIVTLLAGLAMLVVERVSPARPWPAIRTWYARALAFNVVQGTVIYVSGLTWNHWFHGLMLVETGSIALDAGLTYFVITFVFYWWHRFRHESPHLWLWLHQLHHSPRRLELLTTFYKHPAEIVLDSLFSSAIAYGLMGVSPKAATLAFVMTGLAEMFYHWNISTPRWLGYLIQRPESHCVHHQTGVHRYNYSDLPIWDILFGTFRNPARFERDCGFNEEREERIGEMLTGRNVLVSDPFAYNPQA